MPAPEPPPFTITPAIVSLVAEIGIEVGKISALSAQGGKPKLRRDNRIRSVHASLAIENNTLTLDQVTAVLAGKRVLGPPKEIREVENAFAAYDAMPGWNPYSPKDLLAAHRVMLEGLLRDAGKYRRGAVGIAKGQHIVHLAPPSDRVPGLMKNLLTWLKRTDVHPIVASCVFHYELEFIHPFADGNGRMGRLWQTLILSRWDPLFAHVPVESVIREKQAEYYRILAHCDRVGNSTDFVQFLLEALRTALREAAAPIPQGTKLAPSRHQVEILRQCLDEAAISELMASAGRKDRTKFRNQILKPLLDAGLVEMTVPDKPNSRHQKYRTTLEGRLLSG